VKDPDVRAAFKKKFDSYPVEHDPGVILTNIIKKQGWNSEDLDWLATLSVADFEKLFMDSGGDDLTSIIRAALQFGAFGGATESMKKITANATEALRKIGAISAINARRVASYGVSPEAPKAAQPTPYQETVVVAEHEIGT